MDKAMVRLLVVSSIAFMGTCKDESWVSSKREDKVNHKESENYRLVFVLEASNKVSWQEPQIHSALFFPLVLQVNFASIHSSLIFAF